MNKRVTPKERGLIKGALRRVFSRSELRQAAVEATRTAWTDPKRARVKKWSTCPRCGTPTPTYLMEVDHIEPVVPVTKTLEEMTANELVDSIWCDPKNLVAICKPCHTEKTKLERKERTANRKKRSTK